MATPRHNPRVLKALRDEGYHATSADHWDSHTQRMKDLFGVIDVLGLHMDHGTLAVQVTSRGNMSSRRRKLHESEALPYMLAAGWTVELWGYDQPRGPRTAWRVKVERIEATT